MNNSTQNNSFNKAANPWEILMIQIGSIWILDTLYLYLITPLGLIGLILNLISLFVICRINENQPAYKYFKVYILNGIVVCTILSLAFYTRSPRYFGFALSYGSGIFRCKIMSGSYTMGLFGSFINICILFERLSNFKPKLEKYFKRSPYFVSLICLIVSFLVNLPNFLVYEARKEKDFQDALNNSEYLNNFVYCHRVFFFVDTLIGKIIMLLSTSFKDFIFLVLETTLTFMSLYYLKKFFSKKKAILNLNPSKSTSINTTAPNSNKGVFYIETAPSNLSEGSSSALKSAKSNEAIDRPKKRKTGQLEDKLTFHRRSNRRLQVMSLCFAALSILSNVSSLSTLLLFVIFNNGLLFHIFTFINILTGLLKYASNFFLFYFFNKNFRSFIRQIL
jgi:hypothetical protein